MSQKKKHMYSNRLWRSMLILSLAAMLAGCQAKSPTPDSAAESGSAAQEAEAEESGEAKKKDSPAPKAEDPGADVYPGMNLSSLSATQRAQIADIADAEVCPCPDAAESLHECLQNEATQCDTAQQVAVQIAQGVQQGLSQTDIMDGVAKFVANTTKVHSFDLKGVPMKGAEDAKVTVVEFADFECPYCRVASNMLADISEKYGDSVAIYFKQFPLGGHQHSMSAATAALAAHNQGKFWEMHDMIFENQRGLSGDSFNKFAGRLGLNMSKFDSDLKSPSIASAIQRDRQEGDNAGLTGTPTIYINGRKYMGAIEDKALSQAIEAALSEGAAEEEAEEPAED